MKKIIAMLLLLVLVFSITACNRGDENGNDLSGDDAYTRYPTEYDPNIDSWEQIDPADEDVSITWFMDFSYKRRRIANRR